MHKLEEMWKTGQSETNNLPLARGNTTEEQRRNKTL